MLNPFSRLDPQIRRSYVYLVKWMVLSLGAGIVGSCVVRLFFLLTRGIYGVVDPLGLPPPVWALIGAAAAGGVIYRFQPNAAGEGIPSYLRGIRIHNGDLLFSVTFFKFWAALATLSTFGNGGIVGPLGRVSAGICATIEGGLARLKVGFEDQDRRTAAICGLAAAVGAIFHSSIGGGIFAVEIIQRARMGYRDLFPAILSSTTAVFVCKAAEWSSFYSFRAPDEFMEISMVGWLLVIAVLAGVCGSLFTTLYGFTARVIRRKEGNVLLKVAAGSLVAATIAWGVNPGLLGTSTDMIIAVFTDDTAVLCGRLQGIIPLGAALVIMLVSKALCNCITVGSGMSAGFTGPAALIGLLLGAAVGAAVGMDGNDPTFYAFVAAGFSGMLASSMNIPLAAAVMTIEIFGLQYSFPAGLAAVIGFQVTRHRTIYDYALAGAGLSLDEE